MTRYKNNKKERVKPIQIIPFPTSNNNNNGSLYSFKSNKLTIPENNKISDDNDKNPPDCKYSGTYIVKASSYKDTTKMPYNAFNIFKFNSDKYWESSELNGNVKQQLNIYENNSDGSISNNLSYINKQYSGTYNYLNYSASYYNSNNSSKILTNKDINDIKGEWIEIKIPNPIFLYSYSINVPFVSDLNKNNPLTNLSNINYSFDTSYNLTNYISFFPKIFILVGSNDGNNWTYIDEQSLVNSPEYGSNDNQTYCYNSSRNEIRMQVNSIKNFSYYRLIITALFAGNKSAKVCCLTLFGFIRYPVQNKATLQGNTMLQSNLMIQGDMKFNTGTCIESFSGITNSHEYLSEIKNSSMYSFSNEEQNENPTLYKIYNELQKSINNAIYEKNNSLSNLLSYDIFTKQVIENFNDHGFIYEQNSSDLYHRNENTNVDIFARNIKEHEIKPLNQIYDNTIKENNHLNLNVLELDGKIIELNNQIDYITVDNENDKKYDYSNQNFDKPPTTIDGRLTDNRDYIIQQNSVLILSTITVTTLVLALILVYK